MVEEVREFGQRDELLANIQRLSRVVLDRLEEGTREGTLDQAQIRLLGSIAMKSLGLWQEALKQAALAKAPAPTALPRRRTGRRHC